MHGELRSGSSSSCGGCNEISMISSPYEREDQIQGPKRSYLTSRDVHDKVHRCKIARERETVLNEFEDGKTHRPDIHVGGVLPSHDAFGLERKWQGCHEHANHVRVLGNISHTAMYLVVLVKVPTRKPMNLPEIPQVAKLDHALLREKDVQGLDVSVDSLLGMKICKTSQDLGPIDG